VILISTVAARKDFLKRRGGRTGGGGFGSGAGPSGAVGGSAGLASAEAAGLEEAPGFGLLLSPKRFNVALTRAQVYILPIDTRLDTPVGAPPPSATNLLGFLLDFCLYFFKLWGSLCFVCLRACARARFFKSSCLPLVCQTGALRRGGVAGGPAAGPLLAARPRAVRGFQRVVRVRLLRTRRGAQRHGPHRRHRRLRAPRPHCQVRLCTIPVPVSFFTCEV
jgi:hypothetical protein